MRSRRCSASNSRQARDFLLGKTLKQFFRSPLPSASSPPPQQPSSSFVQAKGGGAVARVVPDLHLSGDGVVVEELGPHTRGGKKASQRRSPPRSLPPSTRKIILRCEATILPSSLPKVARVQSWRKACLTALTASGFPKP